VVGRDRALVHEEDEHVPPVEGELHEAGEEPLRGGAAGNRDREGPAAPPGLPVGDLDVLGERLRQLGNVTDDRGDRHLEMRLTCPACTSA
jgi:hypothetical protein